MSKQLTVVDSLKKTISSSEMKDQFKRALPPHIDVEKFTRVLMTAISGSPALANADRTSLFASCLKCAADGLMPDNREASIIVFGNKAQYMPMTGGILKKIRNSGELSSLSPHVVYENDEFSYYIDQDGEKLKHVPSLKGSKGEITHAYCLARTKDGGVYIEVMSKEEIDAVRKSSRSSGSGPWANWYGEMAKKTVIKRLSKRLPSSTDIDMTLHADDELFMPEESEKPEVSEPQEAEVHKVNISETMPKPAKKSKLKSAMTKEAEKTPPPVETIDTEVVPDEDLPI